MVRLRLENIMIIKLPIMLCFYAQTLWYYAAVLLHKNASISDLPKDMYCRSQNMNNQKTLVCSILISAGFVALSTFMQDAS